MLASTPAPAPAPGASTPGLSASQKVCNAAVAVGWSGSVVVPGLPPAERHGLGTKAEGSCCLGPCDRRGVPPSRLHFLVPRPGSGLPPPLAPCALSATESRRWRPVVDSGAGTLVLIARGGACAAEGSAQVRLILYPSYRPLITGPQHAWPLPGQRMGGSFWAGPPIP